MWGLEQMGIWGNGHFGTDEHWGRWALGKNEQIGVNRYLGHWKHWGTGTNRHLGKWTLQSKWAFWTDGRWGKWGQMGTRKNDINNWLKTQERIPQ